MDMHMKDYVSQRKFEDEDLSKRKFDREKDMASRRIDPKRRQDMIEGAAKLDSKFSHGSRTFL
jgi:hypothetical protein